MTCLARSGTLCYVVQWGVSSIIAVKFEQTEAQGALGNLSNEEAEQEPSGSLAQHHKWLTHLNGHGAALTMSQKSQVDGILKYLLKFFCLFFYNLAPLLTSLAGYLSRLFKEILSRFIEQISGKHSQLGTRNFELSISLMIILSWKRPSLHSFDRGCW